jgi:diguanylate cyclase (GGDEF)-like protein
MEQKKIGVYNHLRYYGLGRGKYAECMSKTFVSNVYGLRYVNLVTAIMAGVYALFPIVIEQNLPKAGVYFAASLFAAVMAYVSMRLCRQHKQGISVSKSFVYALMILFYCNAMFFGIYIGVWSNPELSAVTFMGFLISALFLFINSPAFNAALTFCALAVFIVSTIIVKQPGVWIYDVTNASIAGIISVFFTWYITKHKVSAAVYASQLESERSSFYDQSTTDELTGLKNRRDFNQTFHRYLTSYRDTDSYLCLAIADIDCFKPYNDYYGHVKGDECLRAVGSAIMDVQGGMGAYAARVGGEEFAFLWFENDKNAANRVFNQLQQKIEELGIPHEKSTAARHVTVSMGIYVARCGAQTDSQEMYNLADGALYEAKDSGRDRVVIWDAEGNKQTVTP